ncbi:hypothetical protein AB1Y20_018453 [Prymnesium parvum]|uniref:FACT complex subunit SSRP1 n=1 Tax=Prymnesium parvum TaxID=97485 RepID=A0AB34JRZ7_PRYPA|eukprot:CAMPEP_0182817190 /NCGR_PEP_ID=MMETSP0006_2-20121128/11340_1 /TAXON_ID=97485 /ORGANISM="Prymnesium parvum, Strain Texoma1" /LENGTH=686 /DNA_ID=CAMNT_0024943535 /DNA_START=15 /DNA_END=2075 /DNA_ORIENTATION=-
MADSHQFGNILLGGKDQHYEENNGTLKVHANGFGWKSRKSGNVISISKADVLGVEWIKIPHGCQLKLRAKGGFVYKFNGFRPQDKDTIKEYCKEKLEIEMADAHLSYKGWNWGECAVEGGLLTFKVEDKVSIDLPLAEINQASAQGPQGKEKNEAVIEMADDDTVMPEDETLVEMRIFMPTGEEDELEGVTRVEAFVNEIKEQGYLEQAGTALASFEDVPIQVPRGRWEIEMFDRYMKLHGKTYDYKVLYTNVNSIYLLPKPDGYHMALCITLEHALRQGQTAYPHVVMQLPRDQPLSVTINLSEAEISERFDDKLEQTEEGDMPGVIAKVLSAFTKKKVGTLKKDGFNGGSKAEDDRSTAIRCSVKATEGHLYPLDKVFFFIANKPLFIEFEKVSSVEFNRVSAQQSTARTFDLTVHMKDSSSHQFVNLQRGVYKELYRFLTDKKIRIKNVRAETLMDDGGGDDDDEVNDPYLNQLQAEAGGDDDDDEESDDEDFAPGAESDVDEEYDEGEIDDEGANIKKKRSHEEQDGEGSEEDADSDEEEARPKKAKKDEPVKKAKPAPPAGKGQEKKKRAKKDKNAPKKAMSAYMFFMNKNRERIKAENPTATFGDLGKLAGAQWKEMNAEAREEYEVMARADKERQKREEAAYKAAQRAATAGSDDDEGPAAAAADEDDDDDDDDDDGEE